MSHEDEVADEVRAAMREGVADLSAPPTLLGGVHKRYTRRIAARRVGVTLVPLAAAAAVAFLVITPTGEAPAGGTLADGSAPGVTTAPPVEPDVRTLDVDRVTYQVSKALDNFDDAVVHVTVTETDPGDKYARFGTQAVYDNWVAADGQSVRSLVSVDGRPVVDDSIATDGSSIFVDYRDKTWRSTPATMQSTNPEKGTGRILTNVLTPDQIKEAMASGHLKIAGQGEVINGQPTIELLGGIPLTGQVRFWLSEGTYLPVRYQQQNSDGAWSAPADFTWLPPTGENLAQLKASVPDGFTQLPSHP